MLKIGLQFNFKMFVLLKPQYNKGSSLKTIYINGTKLRV